MDISSSGCREADLVVNETVLDTLAQSTAGQWQRFGRLLKLSEATIEMIDLDHPNSFEKCYACINKFKQQNGKITFHDIKTVLQDMERLDVIKTLEEKYLVERPIGCKVQKAIAELRKHYIDRYGEVLRSDGILNISTKKIDRCSSHVELGVTSTEDIEESLKIYSDREFHMHQISLQTYNIQPSKLFKGEERFVSLSGVAGSGKTNLLLYLTMQWAKGELWNAIADGDKFQFVFTVLCRELNRVTTSFSLKDLLTTHFPFVFEHISFDDLQHFAKQILVIVDGLDEYVHLQGMTAVAPECETSKKSKALYEALNCWEPSLSGHYVLAAGRPEASKNICQCFKGSLKMKRVQVIGFNDESIDTFIQKYFNGNQSMYEAVKKKIFQSANFLAMARLPVYISILCMLLESEIDSQIETMATVFVWALGLYVRNHYHGKLHNLANIPLKYLFNHNEVKDALANVFKIAYCMLSEGKIMFDADRLETCGESFEYCGLITTVNINEFETMLQFTHLCLQEFCAAAYMFKDHIDYLLIKGNPLLRGCLPVISSFEGALCLDSKSHPILKAFVASLDVKTNPPSSVVSMLALDVMADPDDKIIIDTADHTVKMFLTSLHESQNDLPTDVCCLLVGKELEIEVNDYSHVSLNSVLFFLSCLWPAHKNAVKKINFFGTLSLLPNEYFMKFSEYFLDIEEVYVKQRTELLGGCFRSMIDCFERKLVQKQNIRLKCLHLNACGMLKNRHMKHVSRIIPYIEQFDMSCNEYVTSEGFQYIANCTKNLEKMNLTLLDLSFCNLKCEQIEVLAPIFPKLSDLRLGYNQKININGWRCFAKSFDVVGVCNCNLRSLDLTQCNITDEALLVLQALFVTLSELFLGLNRKISLDGWSTLSCALIKNETIWKLDLYACNLNDDSLEVLTPVFAKLLELNLCWNRKITTTGWRYMVKVLNQYPAPVKLKWLNVRGCKITSDDLQVLDNLAMPLDELTLSLNSLQWKDIFILDNILPHVQESNAWF